MSFTQFSNNNIDVNIGPDGRKITVIIDDGDNKTTEIKTDDGNTLNAVNGKCLTVKVHLLDSAGGGSITLHPVNDKGPYIWGDAVPLTVQYFRKDQPGSDLAPLAELKGSRTAAIYASTDKSHRLWLKEGN